MGAYLFLLNSGIGLVISDVCVLMFGCGIAIDNISGGIEIIITLNIHIF